MTNDWWAGFLTCLAISAVLEIVFMVVWLDRTKQEPPLP